MDIAGKQLNGLMPQILGDLVNGTTVGVGSCGIKTQRKSATDDLDVAGAGGCENAIVLVGNRTDRVQMCFQGAPTLETVVVGDDALRLMQLGIRLGRAQRGKPLLGRLFEPVKIGIYGERQWHRTPSFFAPGDRGSRARKKEMSAQC